MCIYIFKVNNKHIIIIMLYSFWFMGVRSYYSMSRYRSSFFWYSGWWMVVLFFRCKWALPGHCSAMIQNSLNSTRRQLLQPASCILYIYIYTYIYIYIYMCPNIKANQKEVKATWCMAKGSMHLRHCLWVGFTSKSLNWQTQTCLRLKLKPNNFSLKCKMPTPWP